MNLPNPINNWVAWTQIDYGDAIMNSFSRLARKLVIIFTSVVFIITLVFVEPQGVSADEHTPTDEMTKDLQPTLPEITHNFLGSFAAEAHGNSPDQTIWIGDGAEAEDDLLPFPMQGWHSWDPDNGNFWWFPITNGPALQRANYLFWQAVEMQGNDDQGSWGLLGQSLHLLQDISTPAHAHADPHICLNTDTFWRDCDVYETWLKHVVFSNTYDWFNNHTPDPGWDMSYMEIPNWSNLTLDLQTQLEAAHLEYGHRSSGQELWELGPVGSDPILFQLMYLMAEMADNYNSGSLDDHPLYDYPGEVFNDPLYNPAFPFNVNEPYLIDMRDSLFPFVVRYSTAWIDYFEYQLDLLKSHNYLPLIIR